MKKYFLHDGVSQHGPFELNELKSKNLTHHTPVWFENLKAWTPAGEVEELKDLFSSVPPPFNAIPPQFNQALPPQYDPFRSVNTSNKKTYVIGGSIILFAILTVIYFTSNKSEAASRNIVAPLQVVSDTVFISQTDEKDKIRLEELEEKDRNREAVNAALTRKNMEYRNNWRKYISFETSNYNVDSWGGIYNLEVYVSNNTDKLIEEVIITIDYYKEKGSLYTTKEIAINNIQPHSIGSAQVPSTKRGTRIESKISKITSRSLHFCYDSDYESNFTIGFSGNKNDPWFCK